MVIGAQSENSNVIHSSIKEQTTDGNLLMTIHSKDLNGDKTVVGVVATADSGLSKLTGEAMTIGYVLSFNDCLSQGAAEASDDKVIRIKSGDSSDDAILMASGNAIGCHACTCNIVVKNARRCAVETIAILFEIVDLSKLAHMNKMQYGHIVMSGVNMVESPDKLYMTSDGGQHVGSDSSVTCDSIDAESNIGNVNFSSQTLDNGSARIIAELGNSMGKIVCHACATNGIDGVVPLADKSKAGPLMAGKPGKSALLDTQKCNDRGIDICESGNVPDGDTIMATKPVGQL